MSRRLGYAEAAEELGLTESWMRKNIKRLPHSKPGRTVYFTDADLKRIDEIFHHEPVTGLAAARTPTGGSLTVVNTPAGTAPFKDLRPLPARPRRRTA